MAAISAGIMLWRRRGGAIELLLAHFGGPYWVGKDNGAWAIPKGLAEPGETPAAAALREFAEELGTVPAGIPVPLGRIRQAGGKWVEAFALEGDLDPATVFPPSPAAVTMGPERAIRNGRDTWPAFRPLMLITARAT